MMALHQLGLRGCAKLEFACEKDGPTARLLRAHQKPHRFYEDITTRPVHELPQVDIYAAGFPCQPFLSAGRRAGVDDPQGRGNIFPYIGQYILKKLPRAFLLENVQGLLRKSHREFFNQMLATLRCNGKYLVRWRQLNTADFGIPQNRPRLYIVGVLRAAMPAGKTFLWPHRFGPPPPLQDLLDDGEVERPPVRAAKAVARLAAMTADPLPGEESDDEVHDADATAVLDLYGRMNWRIWMNKVPCLTRTRCGENGYWINNRALGQRGMMTTQEMLRLQGLPTRLIGTARAAGVTDRQLRLMIGNAMSMNVLVCVLRRILSALGRT
jgi:DNA-cytosine methyltransferase